MTAAIMTQLVERLLDPLRRRVGGFVRRGVIALVNDALGIQVLQVHLLAGELGDQVARFQEYGFSSVPPPGAEAILVAVGWQDAYLVAIAVDDKTSRPTGGVPGEVTLYSKFGHRILLKADGTMELKAAPGAPVTGIVTQACACAFTGGPHPQSSLTIKGGL